MNTTRVISMCLVGVVVVVILVVGGTLASLPERSAPTETDTVSSKPVAQRSQGRAGTRQDAARRSPRRQATATPRAATAQVQAGTVAAASDEIAGATVAGATGRLNISNQTVRRTADGRVIVSDNTTGPGGGATAGTTAGGGSAGTASGGSGESSTGSDGTTAFGEDALNGDATEKDELNPERATPTPLAEDAATPTAQQGYGRITGRVVGQRSGQGVAAVLVSAIELRTEYEETEETGSGGSFAFNDLPAGEYVVFTHTGEAQRSVYVEADRDSSVTLQIQSTTEISGVVEDGEGKPLGGITVTLYRGGGQLDLTVSDDDGVYVLLNAPLEVTLEVVAEDPLYGRASERVVLHSLEPEYGIDLKLVGLGRITGWLKDSSNQQGLANGKVVAQPSDGGLPLEATTNGDGYFEFIDVLGGRWELEATVEGYGPQKRDITLSSSTPHKSLTFVMVGGEPMAGIVRDAVTREPIAGVNVAVIGGPRQEVVTGGDGRFRFETVPSNINPTILATHSDYSDAKDNKAVQGDTDIELEMLPQGKLVLRVEGPQNEVVTDYRITFHPHNRPEDQYDDYYYTGLAVHTDDTYEFTLTVAGYRVTITADGYQQWQHDIEVGLDSEKTITLTYGESLAGRITDTAGSGIAGAQVEVYRGEARVISGQPVQVEGGVAARGTTGANGSFTVPNCPGGTVTVVVTASGYVRNYAVTTIGGGAYVTLKLESAGP